MKHHDIRHADARFQYRCPALPITSTSRGIDRKPMHHTSLCFLSILKIYPHHSYFSHLFTFFTTDPSLSLASPPAPLLQTAFDSAEGLRIRRLHPRRVDARQLLPQPHHGQRHQGVLRILLVSQRLKKVTARAPPRRCAAIGF